MPKIVGITVKSHYNGIIGGGGIVCSLSLMSNIPKYSRKYTIDYITSTRNKHRKTKCDFFGFFFILNSFLITKPS
jgi:hypothetical protein